MHKAVTMVRMISGFCLLGMFDIICRLENFAISQCKDFTVLRGLLNRRPASVREHARREIARLAEEEAGKQAHPVAIAAALADAA